MLLTGLPVYDSAKQLAEIALRALLANQITICSVAGVYKNFLQIPGQG